jgi:hypothetical protein
MLRRDVESLGIPHRPGLEPNRGVFRIRPKVRAPDPEHRSEPAVERLDHHARLQRLDRNPSVGRIDQNARRQAGRTEIAAVAVADIKRALSGDSAAPGKRPGLQNAAIRGGEHLAPVREVERDAGMGHRRAVGQGDADRITGVGTADIGAVDAVAVEAVDIAVVVLVHQVEALRHERRAHGRRRVGVDHVELVVIGRGHDSRQSVEVPPGLPVDSACNREQLRSSRGIFSQISTNRAWCRGYPHCIWRCVMTCQARSVWTSTSSACPNTCV